MDHKDLGAKLSLQNPNMYPNPSRSTYAKLLSIII